MGGLLSRGTRPRRPGTGTLALEGAALVWRRGRGAVVAVWAIVTLVSIAAVLPALAWWLRDLGHPIEAAGLLGSPNLSLLLELRRDNPAGVRTMLATAGGAAILAILLNPFLAGGLLGRLSRGPGDDGPAARFAAEGVLHYLPLLLALLLVGAGAGLLSLVVVPVAGTIAEALRGPDATVLGAMIAALVVIAGVATVLLDLARIRIVRGDTRNAAKAVGWAFVFGLPRSPRAAGLALIAGALTACLGAVLLAGQWQLAGGGWPAILGAVLLQQAHALARTWLRAAWLASELVLVDAEIQDGAPVPALTLPSELPASVALAGEERPEVLVVVEGEAGEGGLAGD